MYESIFTKISKTATPIVPQFLGNFYIGPGKDLGYLMGRGWDAASNS